MANRKRGRRPQTSAVGEKDRNQLMFWSPDAEAAQPQLRLVPDAYRNSLFGFVLYMEEDADWWLSASLYRDGLQLSIGHLTVEPNTLKHPDHIPSAGIRSADVRRIKVGDLLDRALREIEEAPARLRAARELVPEMTESFGELGLDEGQEALALRAAEEAEARRPRRGRPRKGDVFFEEIAEEYLAILTESGSRGALQRLAQRKGYSREAARDWVAEARKREYLTPATPGRAGAAPGRRLEETRARKLAKVAPQPKRKRRA